MKPIPLCAPLITEGSCELSRLAVLDLRRHFETIGSMSWDFWCLSRRCRHTRFRNSLRLIQQKERKSAATPVRVWTCYRPNWAKSHLWELHRFWKSLFPLFQQNYSGKTLPPTPNSKRKARRLAGIVLEPDAFLPVLLQVGESIFLPNLLKPGRLSGSRVKANRTLTVSFRK